MVAIAGTIARARQQRAGLAAERGREADIKKLEKKARRAARKQGRGRLGGLLGGLVAATIGNLLLPGLGGFAAKALFGAATGAGSFLLQGKARVSSDSPFLGLGQAASDIQEGLRVSRRSTALEDALTGINIRGGLTDELSGLLGSIQRGRNPLQTAGAVSDLSTVGLTDPLTGFGEAIELGRRGGQLAFPRFGGGNISLGSLPRS